MKYSFVSRILVGIIFFIGLAHFSLYSQNKTKTIFSNLLDSIKEANVQSYSKIHEVLRIYEQDSLKMQQLLSESVEFPSLQAYANNALGIIQRDISNYQAAIKYHETSKRLAQDLNDIELEVVSLNMLGVVYRRMDAVKPALDYHSLALNLARSSEQKSKSLKLSIAVSQNSMGNIYLALKQYDQAINLFNQSLIIESEEQNKLGLAINFHNIGYAEEAKGDFDQALENYQKSLEYNELINSDLGRVICYNSIGEIYIKQKKYELAKPLILEAVEKAISINDQYYIASSYINLGWFQKETGQIKKAKQNLQKGLKTAQTYDLKSSIISANKLLADLYSDSQDYQSALNHYQEAVTLENTIANKQNLQYANDVVMQYETEAKNREILALESQNEKIKSALEKNKKVFWYALIGLVLFASVIIAYNRQVQLQKEKQILTLEQDMLRSQMNPHFIFNSLNSIKLYIINNEKENAVYYLNKFSKLIRKILMASTENDTNLEEELETMKLYMNIENIRFSNEIDFKITVDPGIDTANIKLPSLILQPFLENALWHGLSSKDNDKRISLKVSKPNLDFVSIAIQDNGVGREESARIKKGKLLKRKSVGIEITKARLANFSKDYFGEYKLEIIDLYDKDNIASGTKVLLDIPLNEMKLQTA